MKNAYTNKRGNYGWYHRGITRLVIKRDLQYWLFTVILHSQSVVWVYALWSGLSFTHHSYSGRTVCGVSECTLKWVVLHSSLVQWENSLWYECMHFEVSCPSLIIRTVGEQSVVWVYALWIELSFTHLTHTMGEQSVVWVNALWSELSFTHLTHTVGEQSVVWVIALWSELSVSHLTHTVSGRTVCGVSECTKMFEWFVHGPCMCG